MAKRIERASMTQTDSRGHVIREPRDNATGEAINFRWFMLPEDQMAPAIAATIKFIQRHQGSRPAQLIESTRFYGKSNGFYNLVGSSFSRAASVANNPSSQRMSYNVIQSVIDTLESKMAKNVVLPTFVTNGGDWSNQKKAKQLTKFTQGLFYEQKFHGKSIYAWKDGAVWGDGFVYVYENNKKVCIERVFPHELLVDIVESINGEPRQLHRVKEMDRDLAREMFPELEEHINTVSPASYQDIGGQGTSADLINITESWHLRSGPDADDGVRVICVGDGALCYEYDKDYFPFPHLRYTRNQLGWYGTGVCERLQNLQSELNRSLILKQKSLWMQGSFKVLLEIGSKVVSQHLNNDVATLIYYSGTPPQYVTPPATNPELQQWIDSLVNYMLAQEGISRMSTTGEAPLGVESGKALRTLVQVSDDRFAFMMQEQEEFVLEVARQAVNVARDIYNSTGKYETIFPDKRFMETIDWKDIDLKEEEYTLKAYPTSGLSDDIAGRLSEIQELTQAGMVSPRTARRLLDMPDVEVNDALANAAEDRLHQIFEMMLDEEKVVRFEPGFHDAQLAQQLAIQYINYAEERGAPEKNIQLVRDFLDQVNTEAIQPAMAAQAQMQPQANPTAAPQSNLIQNTPQAA